MLLTGETPVLLEKFKEQAMKAVRLLTAMLAVSLFFGCKASTPPPQSPSVSDTVKAELAKMAATTDQLAKDNSELRKALQETAQKEQSRNDLSAQLDRATKAATDLQNANARLNSALATSEARLQQAAADFTLAGNKAQAARLDAVEEQNRTLSRQHEQLKTTMEGLYRNMDLDQLRTLAKLQKDWEDAQEMIAAVQAQNAMLIQALQQQPGGTQVYMEGVGYPVFWWPTHPIRHEPKPTGGSGGGHGPGPIHPGTQNSGADKGSLGNPSLIAGDRNVSSAMGAPSSVPASHDRKFSPLDRSFDNTFGGGNSVGPLTPPYTTPGGQSTQGSNTSGGVASPAGPSGRSK